MKKITNDQWFREYEPEVIKESEVHEKLSVQELTDFLWDSFVQYCDGRFSSVVSLSDTPFPTSSPFKD